MNLDKFDLILDASDNNFVEQLAKALGLKPGEKLKITTPQFKRTDGRVISYRPNTPEEYRALPKLDADALIKIGCQRWKEEDGKVTWLFPFEWYDHIPDGTIVIDINGEVNKFKRGETDNDIRFGALAFGFTQQIN